MFTTKVTSLFLSQYAHRNNTLVAEWLKKLPPYWPLLRTQIVTFFWPIFHHIWRGELNIGASINGRIKWVHIYTMPCTAAASFMNALNIVKNGFTMRAAINFDSLSGRDRHLWKWLKMLAGKPVEQTACLWKWHCVTLNIKTAVTPISQGTPMQ